MSRSPARRLARWLALAALAAPACGEPFGVADVLGIWNAETINGYAVPGSVLYEGVTYDTRYVRWAFYDGGQCTLTQLVDGVTATYDECEYEVEADRQTVAIVLLTETWDGSVAGDRMELIDPQDVTWVLRAQ